MSGKRIAIALLVLIKLSACAECPRGDDGYTCIEWDIPLPPDCSIACARSY